MGDLADPLYGFSSPDLFSNLEQIRMRTYKDGPNFSGGRQIIKWQPPDIKWRSPYELGGGRQIIKWWPPEKIYFLPGTIRFP